MLIRGDRLTPQQRREVLGAFSMRWTIDNVNRVANWANVPQTERPTIDLCTDDEWLRDHAFYFVADGSRLDWRYFFCEPAFMAEDT